jgi:hypothetical protein
LSWLGQDDRRTDKDFNKYIECKLVAWFRRFPAKNDPDWKKKDEVDDSNGAGEALDVTIYDDGEDQGLNPSARDEEPTDRDSEVPPAGGRAAGSASLRCVH